MLRRIVRYRVYCVILRRPKLASFCRAFQVGPDDRHQTAKIMDAVMYGIIQCKNVGAEVPAAKQINNVLEPSPDSVGRTARERRLLNRRAGTRPGDTPPASQAWNRSRLRRFRNPEHVGECFKKTGS